MTLAKKRSESEVLTVKVTKGLRKRLKEVCDNKGLQMGRLVEHAVLERLEDIEDEEWAMRTLSDRLNEQAISLNDAFKNLKVRK